MLSKPIVKRTRSNEKRLASRRSRYAHKDHSQDKDKEAHEQTGRSDELVFLLPRRQRGLTESTDKDS